MEEEPVPTTAAVVVVGIDTMPLRLWWDTTDDNEEDNSRDAIVLALGRAASVRFQESIAS